MEDAKVGAFFSRLDYGIPGLAPVRDAEARGDRRAAEEAFLDYCRERPQPNLAVRYVSAHTERGFAQNTTGYDFISERYVEEFPDHHVTWRDRARMRPLISTEPGYTWSRTQGIKPSAYTLVDIADLLLDNKVFAPTEPEKGVQDVGAQWDWTHVPDDGDVIWTHHLNYQLFQRALAQAYWLTGDDVIHQEADLDRPALRALRGHQAGLDLVSGAADEPLLPAAHAVHPLLGGALRPRPVPAAVAVHRGLHRGRHDRVREQAAAAAGQSALLRGTGADHRRRRISGVPGRA